MYMLSTKEELYLYLEKISRGYALKDLKYFTANHISESLNISRNLASQYLNELVKEERAIKVNSRPVYFFHKKNVEREAQVALETCVFSGMDDFQRKCRSDENKRDFQKAIGYYLSLSSCIEQCKAAVKYPPNGLPALFNGSGGTGKAFLSRLMYEYAVNERVIGTAGAASLPPYITVDCSEYAQNEEKFAISLCGSEDGKGWLAKANGGILFFDEIDRLPFSGQELIYSYLISGQYKGYHDDEHVFESNARLVFSTTKVPAETLYKPLARMIPIVIPVPTLHERTADEKEEMLVSFLKAEGRRMGVDVSISQNAFHCMLEFSYENNIDELKTCVTSSCAGAYLEKNSDGIAIHSYHLPEYMLSSLKLEVEDKDKRMIHLSSYSRDTSLGQTVQYFQIMLDVFEDYRQDMLSFDGLMMEFRKQLNDYYDYLIYGQKLVNIKISTYEQLINQIFENVGEMYGISLSKKYSHLLARRLYIQLQGDHLIDNWMKQNHDEIEEMFQAVSAVLEKESVICSRIVNLIKLNLDIEADSLNQLFLLLDIKNQNQKIQGLSAAGIILSHGYATASSIADAANQIIGRKVFDAIDMPLDMQMSDITGLLEKHIERFITCQDVVLLVDMGSLEQIHSQMRGLRNLNIGIINNISTALAVDIGLGICGNQKLEDILKRYPYNWNNDNFRRNFHAKALDIKHDADAKLILYQKQIAEKIKGLPAVYLDAAVQDAMKQLQKLFHDYSMALYLFSFASYLEVMLDGRFVAEDLKIVADKVHDYQENYDRQFEQCRDYVKKFSGGSVEMMVAGGIANAAKGLGKLIGSAPILKDGPVDEWLQNCGEQIEKANEEKVAKLAESFAAEQKTGSEIFESSIRNVDELSNQVKGMLFDEEYLYLVA